MATAPDSELPPACASPASSSSAPPPARTDWPALLVRLVLGAVFVYMGMNKVLHPVEFLKLVKQYELVTSPPWLNVIAVVLPWFEVFCGLLLLLGVAVHAVSLNLLLLLIPFSIIVLRRALDISKTQGFAFCAGWFTAAAALAK